MKLLFDESKLFMFKEPAPLQWSCAIVAGALLPNNKQSKWLKKYAKVRKGAEFKPEHEQEICEILDDMYKCRIQGVLLIGDIGHVTAQEAELFRCNFLKPHYDFAAQEPPSKRDALLSELDNLSGKGKHRMSPQDFFKTISLLESISELFRLFMTNLAQMSANDLRNIKVIIDTQPPAATTSLQEFIYYFIMRRSQDNPYPNKTKMLELLPNLITMHPGCTTIDVTKLLPKIIIGSDDIYPELKIADLLSNFSNKALKGLLSNHAVDKLKLILKTTKHVCFHPENDIFPNGIPPTAQYAVNLFFNN